jgi:selenide,water dikinase
MEKMQVPEIPKTRLTDWSKGSGCGCKISPADLKQILHSSDGVLPPHPDLWVGYNTSDDAAVLRWNDDIGLISTVDFFTPMVNTPRDFGKVAAANALSDVYAMGGRPLMAIAILGWPVGRIPLQQAGEVLDGARFICQMAGIPLAGGHSIESSEPFFGLAVSGSVNKTQMLTNAGAKPGDVLILTKPIGNGIILAAEKRGLLTQEIHLETALSYMCSLNKVGAELHSFLGVHALTDITGFGLLGHLTEMCVASNVSAEVEFNKIPTYPFLADYISKSIYPDMTMKNYSHFAANTSPLGMRELLIMCDPQTSGGLLISVAESSSLALLKSLNESGHNGSIIGRCLQPSEKRIFIQ